METKKVLLIIFAGVFIGVANGLFGGGGGMVCVPLLLLLGLDNQHAQATTILIMLPISLASAIIYLVSSTVEWDTTLWVGLGSVAGGVLGSFLLSKLNNKVLGFIFAFGVLGVGIRLLF